MKNFVILNNLRKKACCFLSCSFINASFEVNLIIDLMNYFSTVKGIHIFFLFTELDVKKNEEIKTTADSNKKSVPKDREKHQSVDEKTINSDTRMPTSSHSNEDIKLKTNFNDEKRSDDEKKTKIPIPKSIGQFVSPKPVIEKPLTVENASDLASKPHQSTGSKLQNGSKIEKNNDAISPDRQCERLEKTVPPESEKTISLNVSITTGDAPKHPVKKSSDKAEDRQSQSQTVTAGPVLSPRGSPLSSPPGGASNSQSLPAGPVMSPKDSAMQSPPTTQKSQMPPFQSPTPAQDSVPSSKVIYTKDEITEALLLSQNTPGMMSAKNADVLVSVLAHPDPTLRLSALLGINKCSTFTRNQVL